MPGFQNHAVKQNGTDMITGYISVEDPVNSPTDEKFKITAFEWGTGPVRVRTAYTEIFLF